MYVGLSAQLKRDIKMQIQKMGAAQLSRIQESTHPFPNGLTGEEWRERIERRAWGDPIRLKDQIPDDWLRPHSAVDVHFELDTDRLEVVYSGDQIDFPPTFEQRYAPDVTFNVEDLEPELVEKIKRYFTLQKDTIERYAKTEHEVEKLLDRCKSLNEAVIVFPDLRYFLTEDIKRRLDAKRKEEEERDKRLEGIDTALITSAIVVEQLHPQQEE